MEVQQYWKKRFGEKFDDLPIILNEYFNITFVDDTDILLMVFFSGTLGLTMYNYRKFNNTKYKTTRRYLHKFQSNIFISYFSYHRPIVTFLEYHEIFDQMNNLSLVETIFFINFINRYPLLDFVKI